MKREDVKRAVLESVYIASDDDVLRAQIIDFATEQINAALEEAAKVCDDGDDPNRFVARIRALKIGAGES